MFLNRVGLLALRGTSTISSSSGTLLVTQFQNSCSKRSFSQFFRSFKPNKSSSTSSLRDLFRIRSGKRFATGCDPNAPVVNSQASTTGSVGAASVSTRLSLWQRYLLFTESHPLIVQGLTFLCFTSTGNLLSQLIVEKRSFDNIDWQSVGKFAAVGVFASFPIIRTWLWTLERAVPASRAAPLMRMLLDQLLFAPIFLAGFIMLMGFVEGTGLEDAKSRLRNDWKNVVKDNWKLWPAAQLINFYFVPFNQRILFGSVVALFWNTYLAFVVRKSGKGVLHEDDYHGVF